MQRYWNGLLQVSEENEILYDGSVAEFNRYAEIISDKVIPGSRITETKLRDTKNKELKSFIQNELINRSLQDKVSVGLTIPKNSSYRLMKSLTVDLAAQSESLIFASSIDFKKGVSAIEQQAIVIFEGFHSIKISKKNTDFTLIIHKGSEQYNPSSNGTHEVYDRIRYRCNALNIKSILKDEVPNYLDELAMKESLAPFQFLN